MSTDTVTVRVKQGCLGYYNHKRRREGDVFEMDMEVFSVKDKKHPQGRNPKWCEAVDGNGNPTGDASPKVEAPREPTAIKDAGKTPKTTGKKGG